MKRIHTIGTVIFSGVWGALCVSASAELVSVDLGGNGDGLITLDTETGLRWLDWAQTRNRSYDIVARQLSPGGSLDGYRYATEDEVRTLYEHAGAVYIDEMNGIDPENIPATQLLASLLGETCVDGCSEAVFALEGDEDTIETVVGDYPFSGPRHHVVTAFNTDYGRISMRWLNIEDTSRLSFVGHALVMVPSPGTVVLGALSSIWSVRHRR
jgi:hypothetical protein